MAVWNYLDTQPGLNHNWGPDKKQLCDHLQFKTSAAKIYQNCLQNMKKICQYAICPKADMRHWLF